MKGRPSMFDGAWKLPEPKRGSACVGATAFLCLLLCFVCFAAVPSKAFANGGNASGGAPQVDATGDAVSLTVRYETEEGFVENAQVSVYRVADVLDDGSLAPVSELAAYPINWNATDSSSAQDLANTLKAYILLSNCAGSSSGASSAASGLAPIDFGVTDANGVVAFPTESRALDAGCYLIMASSHAGEENFFEASPVLLQLPFYQEDGQPVSNLSINLKIRSTSLSQSVSIDAMKIWDVAPRSSSDDEQKARPDWVNVALLCDGKVYERASLNSANGWRYSWDNLDAACSWTVVEEDVPAGYVVSIKEDGRSLSVVNQYVIQKDKQELDGDASQESKKKLPQTGQLWWPVPVLLIVGACCFAVGFALRRKA